MARHSATRMKMYTRLAYTRSHLTRQQWSTLWIKTHRSCLDQTDRITPPQSSTWALQIVPAICKSLMIHQSRMIQESLRRSLLSLPNQISLEDKILGVVHQAYPSDQTYTELTKSKRSGRARVRPRTSTSRDLPTRQWLRKSRPPTQARSSSWWKRVQARNHCLTQTVRTNSLQTTC